MVTFKRFEDIEAWRMARSFSKKVRETLRMVDSNCESGITKTIFVSCGEIMDQIALGFDRGNQREFMSALKDAKGACAKLQSQLYRAFDYELLNETQFDNLLGAVEALSIKIENLKIMLKQYEVKVPQGRRITSTNMI